MRIKVPTRKPRFSDVHPSRASFDAARRSSKALGKAVESHIAGLAPLDGSGAPEALTAEMLATAGNVGHRQRSEQLCDTLKPSIVPAAQGRIEELLITPPSYVGESGRTISSRNERLRLVNIGYDSGIADFLRPLGLGL